MSRWRYESVILKPSPIEIFATMIAFSPTRADAFSMLITTGDFESAATLGRPLPTTAVNATSVTTRRLTRRVPPRIHAPGEPVVAEATGSPGRKTSSRHLLRNREDPDHAARGNVL